MSAVLLLALACAAACKRDSRTPLVLYSPHGRDLLGLVEAEFEQAHPDVDVRWLDMGSQEVYDRLRSEKANPQADVWFGGPDTIFARGVRDGLLAPYRPAWADAVSPQSRHPGDLYFGLYRTPAMPVYNAKAITADQAPRDWDDLLDPKWKGKVLIRDPLAVGHDARGLGHDPREVRGGDRVARRGFAWLAPARRADQGVRAQPDPALREDRPAGGPRHDLGPARHPARAAARLAAPVRLSPRAARRSSTTPSGWSPAARARRRGEGVHRVPRQQAQRSGSPPRRRSACRRGPTSETRFRSGRATCDRRDGRRRHRLGSRRRARARVDGDGGTAQVPRQGRTRERGSKPRDRRSRPSSSLR